MLENKENHGIFCLFVFVVKGFRTHKVYTDSKTPVGLDMSKEVPNISSPLSRLSPTDGALEHVR